MDAGMAPFWTYFQPKWGPFWGHFSTKNAMSFLTILGICFSMHLCLNLGSFLDQFWDSFRNFFEHHQKSAVLQKPSQNTNKINVFRCPGVTFSTLFLTFSVPPAGECFGPRFLIDLGLHLGVIFAPKSMQNEVRKR